MFSNCCGAEPSYLNNSLCGQCLEHADFYDYTDEINLPIDNINVKQNNGRT